MKKYTETLEIMLRHVSVEEILKGDISYDRFGKGTFVLLANSCISRYSENELANMYAYFEEEMLRQRERLFGNSGARICIPNAYESEQCLSVFELLLGFSEQILQERGKWPICNYMKLLRWRMTSHSMDEDLFITAYLAYRDVFRQGYSRDLRWDFVIGTDNEPLNRLLEKGIAENHFHLKGSAPYFHLSWLSIMNHFGNPRFKRILDSYDQKRQNNRYSYNPSYGEQSLFSMYRKAAVIRLALFMKLSGKRFVLRSVSVRMKRLKYYFDYKKLSECFFDCRMLRQKGKTLLKQYKRIELAKVLWESIIGEGYAKLFLENIFSEIEVGEDFFAGLYEEKISLAEILNLVLSDDRNIPIESVKGLISEKARFLLEEECMLEFLGRILNDESRMDEYEEEIRDLIEIQRWEQMAFSGSEDLSDYAISAAYPIYDWKGKPCSKNDKNVITGERWLLYQMFQKYYTQNEEFAPYLRLFYAYLVLKENIRAELIQVNSYVGFSNFSSYEKRKEDLIENTVFEKYYLRLAVSEIMQKGNVRSLEVRVSPKMSAQKDADGIFGYDEKMGLNDEEKARLFYVYHFVKEKDRSENINSDIRCRHEHLRAKLRTQALEFARMREEYQSISKRVLGIDACNEEITCRPEVFAHAFRFLKNHLALTDNCFDRYEKGPDLGVTYHVGEDFLDVVDGLRAIDEACEFLNMRCGDRIGHALVLGIDVRQWYEGKDSRIMITKQAYLDNLVWMHTKLRETGVIGFEALILEIEKDFWKYFHEVYLSHILERNFYGQKVETDMQNKYRGLIQFDLHTYYEAWKLRGDDPSCYIDGGYKEPAMTDYGWSSYKVNRNRALGYEMRHDYETAYLYHSYHYNSAVKCEGEKILEIKVTKEWIRAAEIIQKNMQKKVASMGIGIETNPSSNYLIGTFKRYDRHPMLRLYNIGLEIDPELLRECPQIQISINTDDQGVFATCLENEYAIMALALERITDEVGKPKYSREQIYKWIDNIRENGLRQSFLRTLIQNFQSN